jgi:hypothetical protein
MTMRMLIGILMLAASVTTAAATTPLERHAQQVTEQGFAEMFVACIRQDPDWGYVGATPELCQERWQIWQNYRAEIGLAPMPRRGVR